SPGYTMVPLSSRRCRPTLQDTQWYPSPLEDAGQLSRIQNAPLSSRRCRPALRDTEWHPSPLEDAGQLSRIHNGTSLEDAGQLSRIQ
ncbi:hypothetical protein NDU88_007232, partial [Pleurodeles waltl]